MSATATQLPPGSDTTAEAYRLRATVLGGSVISEYKGDATWSKTHVYAGAERLGQQTTAEVGTAQSILQTLDPVTGDGMKRLSNGSFSGSTTMDPGGVDVGSEDPFPPDGSGAEGGGLGELTKTVPFITPIEGGGAKCVLDGLEIDCSRISGNSSVQCPNNDCNATVRIVGRKDGEVVGVWIEAAPEGWDPSYDGTYKFNDGLPWRRRRGPAVARSCAKHSGQQPRQVLAQSAELCDSRRDCQIRCTSRRKIHRLCETSSWISRAFSRRNQIHPKHEDP
jgi:hypothetical protein